MPPFSYVAPVTYFEAGAMLYQRGTTEQLVPEKTNGYICPRCTTPIGVNCVADSGSHSLLDQLLTRLQERESLELEFKAAKRELPASFWPTVSAFANTHGGWIVFGIDESADPPIVGMDNPEKMLQQIRDLMRNAQKIDHPVCGPTDVGIEPISTMSVVVARVPAVAHRARPVFINGNPYSGTYVRRYTGDYRCSRSEVDRMIRESGESSTDSAVLAHSGYRDLDPDAINRYRQRFQTQNPQSPWNGYDQTRFLEAVGVIRRDLENGTSGLTVAGLLLLGRPEAITSWRGRHLIDFRVLPNDDSDQRWLDRVAWEGGLFQAFEVIYPRVISGLSAPFQLVGGFRIDEGPQQEALREALVNLLVHADYAERDVSLIIRRPDGFLFRNPGSSRIPESDLFSGDRSDPRNPTLVRLFRHIGLADEAGTGMPKIIQAWRKLGFRLPEIETGVERYEFTLHLRHAHFLSDDDRQWLHSFGDQWGEAEQIALVIARHRGEVDNASIRRLTGQHMVDVTRVLGGLRDRGFLEMDGTTRGARYRLGPSTIAAASSSASQLSFVDDEAHVDTHTPSLSTSAPSLGTNAPSLGTNVPSLGTSSTYSRSSSFTDTNGTQIAQTLWTELQAIAQPARDRSRLTTAKRTEIMLRLCSLAPLSVSEIAGLLGRRETIVRRALQALLSQGLLAYQYPEQPSHPRQRYRTPPHRTDDT